MGKISARLWELLCPVEAVRKQLKARRKLEKLQRSNSVEIDPEDLQRVHLRGNGSNNRITIGRLQNGGGRLNILLHGDGNEITIGEGLAIADELLIVAGIEHANFGPVQDVHIHIGKQCGFENVSIQTFNSHAQIYIGENCMFSYGINVYHTDGHPVLSVETGKVLNKVRKLHIGNHVWVGAQVTINKNVTIGDDCILGWGAVVSRSFPEANCAIAGNPAQVVKRGITWDANEARHGYIDNKETHHETHPHSRTCILSRAAI